MNWVSQFLADGFDEIEAGSFPGGIDTEKRKPELRAPASGPLDWHWGCDHITAWRGTGGQPA